MFGNVTALAPKLVPQSPKQNAQGVGSEGRRGRWGTPTMALYMPSCVGVSMSVSASVIMNESSVSVSVSVRLNDYRNANRGRERRCRGTGRRNRAPPRGGPLPPAAPQVPQDPTVGLCLGPYGRPMGGGSLGPYGSLPGAVPPPRGSPTLESS